MISKEVDKMKFSEYLNEKGYGINKVVELIDVLADTDIDFKAIQDYQKTQSLSKKQLIIFNNIIFRGTDTVVFPVPAPSSHRNQPRIVCLCLPEIHHPKKGVCRFGKIPLFSFDHRFNI